MTISRYEESKNEAMKAMHHAICENNYYCKDEYLIAIQNVTDGYNVDFTHTNNGEWADEVFKQACDISVGCAYTHKDTKYIVILAKSRKDCTIEFIKENHLCVKTK